MSMMGRLAARLLRRPADSRETGSDSVARQLAAAQACLRAGRNAEAEDGFARCLDTDPANLPALFGLGCSLFRQGLHDEALEAGDKALALASPSLVIALASPMAAADFLLGPGLPPDVISQGSLIEEHAEWMGAAASRTRPASCIERAGGIAQALLARPQALRLRPEKLALLSALLGFVRQAEPSVTAALFDVLIEPLLRRALAGAEYETGLVLENLSYSRHVLQTETGSHFGNIYRRLAPMLCEAGKRMARTLPTPSWPGRTRPAIGFFINNADILAHVEVLLDYLEALKSGPDPAIDPEVYVFSGPMEGSTLQSRLKAAGVPVFALDAQSGHSPGLCQRLLALRSLAAQRELQAMVWTSAVPYMCLAFSLRIAPVQIWWAMKYHDLECDDIDGHVTGGSTGRFKQIGTRLWRTGPLGGSAWFEPGLTQRAAALRTDYLASHDIILASIGREEKLNSPAFLECVCNILRANPRAVFLWTGRSPLPQIQEAFDARKVSHQCRFIGWVDTRLHAQVIDLFLDSFPFPSGFTAIQAMAAARPVVMYESPESHETGLHGLLAPLLAGQSGSADEQATAQALFGLGTDHPLLPAASSSEAYQQQVQRLIDDPAHRLACGEAARRFVQEFLSNPSRMAQSYTGHFLEIIAETRHRHSAGANRDTEGPAQAV